jgi:HEAT repeat protein
MTENKGSVTVTAVMQPDSQSFLKDELQLKKLSKELSKATKEAIEVLVKLLESTDEKVRMQAATKLLEFDIDVKKALSTDQMQRLIAEIKLNGGGTKKLELDDESGGKQKVVVDFSNIRSIE